ncbi:nuclear transport factor 2 family protein [Burkholderia plantarii]|uniref:nuclear transport factor 2 family protein n=1 Tax=Burkholderia plantarii TaxID=41899 RepID=UPI0018DDC601|nr:nuclear transport factor 2 family protein [Burkholderia plantarii]MBI0325778.1 nuclear transport factor 2 family protein [Burkholderia plantarii]
MSTARELISEFFDCLRNLDTSVDRCVDLFADDGVFELPYFPSIGIDPRFEGKDAIRRAFELIRSHFSSFMLSNIEIHELKNEAGLFAEYHSDGFIDGTARVYAQDYASRLVVENGKIKLLREYLNIIATARMLLPNGLADVPEPAK